MASRCNFDLNRLSLGVLVGWAALLFVPSLLMILAGMSSFLPGVLLVACLLVMVGGSGYGRHDGFSFSRRHVSRRQIFTLLAAVGAVTLLLLHFLLVNIVVVRAQDADLLRFSASFCSLCVLLWAAWMASRYLQRMADADFHRVTRWLSLALLLNALISLTQIDFLGSGTVKPTFIYLEPSHFALVVAPFLIYYCRTARRISGCFALLFALLWALYIQNLTLVVAVLIAFLASTRKNLLLAATLLFSIGGLIFISLDNEVLSYFYDRLDFSSSSDNLSVLVLFLGWENALATLLDTSWVGGGFQQFGVTTLSGEYADKIFQMVGFDLNRYDGGSTAPKLIGEFGLLGLVLVCGYLIFWAQIFRSFRRYDGVVAAQDLFAKAVFIASFMEMFVRGVGYFSPLLFMFLVSVFYFLNGKFLKNRVVAYEASH